MRDGRWLALTRVEHSATRSARLELESARQSFAKVGARRDLHAVEALLGSSSPRTD